MSLKTINVISVVYYFWLLFASYLGSVLILLGVKPYFIGGVSDQEIKEVFLIVCYVMVTLPFGIRLANLLFFKYSPKYLLEKFYDRTAALNIRINLRFWVICLIISILAGLYSGFVLPKIPIFKAFSGSSSDEILYYRYIAKFDFPGIIYIKNLFFHKLALICAFVFYTLYLKRKNDKYTWLAIVAILWGAYSELFNGEKGPIVFYLLSLSSIYFIISGKGLSRKGLKGIGIAVLAIGLMYYFIEGKINLSLTSGMISRLVLVPMGGMYLTLSYWPERTEFLRGASFPDWLVSLFGMEHQRSARIIMELRNIGGVEEGTAGVVNSLFTAEAYANFGSVGLILSPFIVGLVLGIIHFSIIRRPMNFISIVLMVYFMFNIPLLGGFVDFIWNVSWFFVAAVVQIGRKVRI